MTSGLEAAYRQPRASAQQKTKNKGLAMLQQKVDIDGRVVLDE